jgi:hypothetical protein
LSQGVLPISLAFWLRPKAEILGITYDDFVTGAKAWGASEARVKCDFAEYMKDPDTVPYYVRDIVRKRNAELGGKREHSE